VHVVGNHQHGKGVRGGERSGYRDSVLNRGQSLMQAKLKKPLSDYSYSVVGFTKGMLHCFQ
jgi:hypothetical protein